MVYRKKLFTKNKYYIFWTTLLKVMTTLYIYTNNCMYVTIYILLIMVYIVHTSSQINYFYHMCIYIIWSVLLDIKLHVTIKIYCHICFNILKSNNSLCVIQYLWYINTIFYSKYFQYTLCHSYMYTLVIIVSVLSWAVQLKWCMCVSVTLSYEETLHWFVDWLVANHRPSRHEQKPLSPMSLLECGRWF